MSESEAEKLKSVFDMAMNRAHSLIVSYWEGSMRWEVEAVSPAPSEVFSFEGPFDYVMDASIERMKK